MPFWTTTYDWKARAHRHTLPPGLGHALLTPLVSEVFKTLRVSAFLYDNHQRWWPLHEEPSLVAYELEHGTNRERIAYNERCVADVRRQLRSVRAEYAGHSDLFVPVIIQGTLAAILVVGPFALARPTSEDILKRWHALTGRQGNLADPEFATYVSIALQILVLDRTRTQLLEKLVGSLASLMAADGNADSLVNQAELLRVRLAPTRLAERHWEAAKTMLDERTQWTWAAAERAFYLRDLGVSRAPDHVLVGLAVTSKPELDPVEEAVRRDGLQRAAVDLAARVGNVIAGRVGDHGVVFLGAWGGTPAQRKQRFADLADEALAVGRRRFGFSFHFGAGPVGGALSLNRRYEAALAAAEQALAQGTRLLVAKAELSRPKRSLRHLRQELSRAVEEAPDSISARFERYLATVELECGHHFDTARGHLEAGFEIMALPLVRRGTLDPKSFSSLCEILDRRAAEARTVSDLFAAYRRAATDVSAAVLQPVAARRDRSLRAAIDFIHQHFTDALDFEQVARQAGFAPNYFSALFKKREGMTFERYVLGLRLERARQLLTNTELEVARIADLCGFGTAQYFCRAFRQGQGETPNQYRKRRVLRRPRSVE